MSEITSNVLESSVRDPGTPGEVEVDQFPQVLRYQLDPVIIHLAAAGQRQNGQVWKRVN